METKRIPNPNGRKGCLEHQNRIKKIMQRLASFGLIPDDEHRIDLANGDKRYADVVGIDPNGNLAEIHQIGKQNQDGTPVAREQRAIKDIEEATGIKVTFTAYNITIGTLVFLGISLAISMIYLHSAGVQFSVFGFDI